MGKAESEFDQELVSRGSGSLPVSQSDLLSTITGACLELLEEYTAGAVDSDVKAGRWHDLVTSADQRLEELITQTILDRYPKDAILGEESGGSVDIPVDGRRWIIDPIDGTTNFVRGIPGWAISIAAEDEQGLLAATIIDPNAEEVYLAERDRGATLNGRRIAPERLGNFDGVVYAGHFAYNYDQEDNGRKYRLYEKIRYGHRSFGSAATSLAYTAAGRVDATYFEVPIFEWDVAAGMLLCREAGLRAELLDPAENGEHRRLIAAEESLFEEMLRLSDSA